MNRPLRLDEILQFYQTNPLPVQWIDRQEVKAVILQKFEHGGQHFAPDPKADPRDPPVTSFDAKIAWGLQEKGLIGIKSAAVDFGLCTLIGIGQVRAFKPWPKSLPDGSPDYESAHRPWVYLVCQLTKLITLFPGIGAELERNEIFITSIDVIRLVSHSIEGIESSHRGPVEILQPVSQP